MATFPGRLPLPIPCLSDAGAAAWQAALLIIIGTFIQPGRKAWPVQLDMGEFQRVRVLAVELPEPQIPKLVPPEATGPPAAQFHHCVQLLDEMGWLVVRMDGIRIPIGIADPQEHGYAGNRKHALLQAPLSPLAGVDERYVVWRFLLVATGLQQCLYAAPDLQVSMHVCQDMVTEALRANRRLPAGKIGEDVFFAAVLGLYMQGTKGIKSGWFCRYVARARAL